jgi:cytochrome c
MRVVGRWLSYAVLVVALGGAALIAAKRQERPTERPKNVQHRVHMPTLSQIGRKGKEAFDSMCAQCHGQNGSGSDKGPPLVHRVYHPGHHGDAAFFLAAKKGVRRHHWKFGDMPAQPHVTDEQIAAIVGFVREVQVANGIGK